MREKDRVQNSAEMPSKRARRRRVTGKSVATWVKKNEKEAAEKSIRWE